MMKRKEGGNAYPKFINLAEIRYRMHRAYVRDGREAEALKCLELVPKLEVVPKILLAHYRSAFDAFLTPYVH